MDTRLEKNKEFVCFLCVVKGEQLKQLLGSITPEQVNTVCEMAKTLLYTKAPIPKKVVKKLKPAKKTLEFIADRKNKAKDRKKAVQKGGWMLPLLASAIVPLLTS